MLSYITSDFQYANLKKLFSILGFSFCRWQMYCFFTRSTNCFLSVRKAGSSRPRCNKNTISIWFSLGHLKKLFSIFLLTIRLLYHLCSDDRVIGGLNDEKVISEASLGLQGVLYILKQNNGNTSI